MYATFVLWPLVTSLRYSMLDWNGIGESRWVGFRNYHRILTDPAQLTPILNSLKLIAFFTIVPVVVGLVSAASAARSEKPFPRCLPHNALPATSHSI